MFIWCILSGIFILFLAALCLMTGFKRGIDEKNTEKYLVKNVSERGICRLASGILLKKEESAVLEEGDLIDLGESQIFQVGERKVDENPIR
mgnify:CR=1 FL=1